VTYAERNQSFHWLLGGNARTQLTPASIPTDDLVDADGMMTTVIGSWTCESWKMSQMTSQMTMTQMMTKRKY
jgi:hypothetical protein